VLERIDAVLTELVNAEIGQRGYVITGEESYLGPYNASITHVGETVKKLRDLTADNASRQRRLDSLDPLITAKLTELEDPVQIRRQQGTSAAVEAVRSGSGKELMDEIRQLLAGMRDEEQRLLQQRSEVADASFKRTKLPSASEDFERLAGERRRLAARLHVEAGLVHGANDLVATERLLKTEGCV
jgi:CHASE3 domain sensor protein